MAEPQCIDVATVEFFFLLHHEILEKITHIHTHVCAHTHILKYGAYLNTSGGYANTENLYFLMLSTYLRGCDQNNWCTSICIIDEL